jgi:2,4-dienoyl-CoA reductase-like NADH-dependent reductase (Old Yellow Enzyme family)
MRIVRGHREPPRDGGACTRISSGGSRRKPSCRARKKGLAYLHIIEGDTSGLPVPTFDYKNLKRTFGGLVIANNGFDKPRANKAIADGRADLIAFGKPFIANPGLVIRLFLDAPLTPVNRETLYGGSEQGYTDYPMLRAVAPHACYHGKGLGVIITRHT